MRSAKRHRNSILSLLLMLVMIFNIAGTTLFVHSHDIGGISIVHSHPYAGLPTSHTHTSSHAGLIARLAAVDMLLAEPLAITASILELHSATLCVDVEFHDTWCAASTLLRAPPFVVA